MRPFRFSAEAALAHRRRQEDDARLVLTRAQNAAVIADRQVADARASLEGAHTRFVSAQQQGAPGWLIGWHQSWISRQSREVDIRGQQAATAHGIVAHATHIVREAHRKRLVLERLRDRLAARHAQEEARRELAQMNDLALMRYLIARADERDQPDALIDPRGPRGRVGCDQKEQP